MRSTKRSAATSTRLVALVSTVSLLTAACGDDTETTAASVSENTETPATTSAAPTTTTEVVVVEAPTTLPVVSIAAADHLLDGPSSPVAAGPVTLELTNNGEEFHHVQVWQVDDADSASAAIEAGDLSPLQAGIAMGGVGAIEGGGTVGQLSTTLDAGEYVIFCLIHTPAGAHNELGMVGRLDVADEPTDAELPDAADELVISSGGFELPTEWDGNEPLSITNTTPFAADAEFLRLAPDTTRDDFLAFMDGSRPGPPPFSAAGGVSGLGPDRTAVVIDPLEPGDYLVASFSPDPTAAMAPQFTTGLLTELTIR